MYNAYIKRAIDVLIALIALIVFFVPMALIALLIVADSKGPALFIQKRVGKDKRHFMIYKFRTMRTDTPVDAAKHLMQNADAYITRVGRVLRALSLDELPQLINILRGDMSFIGPRPALWNQFDLIAERDRCGANGVRPGLSGLAQVMGRDELDVPEKARLDGQYAKHMSFLLDARIFIKTFVSVINMEGYAEGGAKKSAPAEKAALVSVVVTACGQTAALAQALELLRGQTYAHVQTVLVDDGGDAASTEAIRRLAEEKAEQGLSLIRIVNGERLGEARARNAGIAAAAGEYVAFLREGERLSPGDVERMLHAILENGAQYCVLSEDGVRGGYLFKKEYLTKIGMFIPDEADLDGGLLSRADAAGGKRAQ